MERHAGKRERIEESDQIGLFCEESEASPQKRLCKDSNIDLVCEIMSKMDNEDVGVCPEEIEEEMVWDMMKMFEEEIGPSPSCSDDTGTSSNWPDELESGGNEACSLNAELDYLLGASDDELGIPCSPSVDTVNDYVTESYDFFECVEMEEVEQQLLLQIWKRLNNSESVEQDGSDFLYVYDLNTVSNQIEPALCKV
ncbi:hypothetical protein SUGI_0501350 [Cryptomeria japonica]|nr:hypothetical protein SUGI_0501350 [Cryptomeria japonica]